MAFSSVLEEQAVLASAPDLDSCPDCGDVMVNRGGEKACAGCGTRQPIVTVARHDWRFVAKMVVAANEYHRRKTAMDFEDPAFTPGTDAYAIEEHAQRLGPGWEPIDSEPGEWLIMQNKETGDQVYIDAEGPTDQIPGTEDDPGIRSDPESRRDVVEGIRGGLDFEDEGRNG